MAAIPALLVALGGAFLLLRLGCVISPDTPVRLSRTRRLVQVYEFQYSWNPFEKWPTTIKTLDRDNLRAQIIGTKGFSGKAYIVRTHCC